jgi:hypothetical protein
MDVPRQILAQCVLLWLAVGWVCSAAASSTDVGDVYTSLYVQVDRHANVYVEGVQVDTLLVCRRQWVHWQKRDPEDSDLSIQFQRGSIHPRHPVQIRVSDRGRPAVFRVDISARQKTYIGRPGRGFESGLPDQNVIYIRVVPPHAE